jgi:hypothetical protein
MLKDLVTNHSSSSSSLEKYKEMSHFKKVHEIAASVVVRIYTWSPINSNSSDVFDLAESCFRVTRVRKR